MKKRILIILFLALTVGVSIGTAADRDLVDDGLRQYQWGAYEKALSTFEGIYFGEDVGTNVYASLSLFMIIQCDAELKNYSRIIENSREFEQNFTESRYLSDVLFQRAKALLEKNSAMASMLTALNALAKADDKDLKKDIIEFCEFIGRFYLASDDLETISMMIVDKKALIYLKLIMADRYISSGNFPLADQLLNEAKSGLSNMEMISKYKSLVKYYNKSFTNQAAEINIAVVLPLTGKYSSPGGDLLTGIKYALENKRNKSKKRVNLIILDTQSDIQTALTLLKGLLKMQNVSAVIGPMTSELAISMAPLCEYAGIPMISPTATSDGLTDFGDYIFQFNPSRRLRAKSIANYASDSLGYSRFAIISPSNDYGVATSDEFTKTVESNGGTIVHQLWYQGNPTSIGEKLSRLQDEAEFLPPYFSYLEGYRESLENGFFDTTSIERDSLLFAADSLDSLAADSLFVAMNDTGDLLFAADTNDTVTAISEDTLQITAVPDTNFILDSRWADPYMHDSLMYFPRKNEYFHRIDSDTTITDYFKIIMSGSLSPALTIEEKYNTIIHDSLCILLDAVDSSLFYEDLMKILDFSEIDSAAAEFELLSYWADTTSLTPYINMALVDSISSVLKNIDSLSALWLLHETDSLLMPYIFPVEKYGIDAVYVPAEQSHIKYLAPQWARYRFDAHLLGDGNWYKKDLLKRYKSNIDSMIIASDYIWESRDIRLRRFSKSFNQEADEYPNRIHIYGYETMDIILDIIENGNLTANEIRRTLVNYQGKTGLIRLVEFRPENPQINSGVRLINFYKGKLETIR